MDIYTMSSITLTIGAAVCLFGAITDNMGLVKACAVLLALIVAFQAGVKLSGVEPTRLNDSASLETNN